MTISATNGSNGTESSRSNSSASDGNVRADLLNKLRRMQHAQRAQGAPSAAMREAALDRLVRTVLAHKEAIAAACAEDFGSRSRHESFLAEVMPVVNSAKHAREHLRTWMKDESRPVFWAFRPAQAEVRYQPLGVVGVIAPWNYPFNLALCPLVCSIAAGNRTIIKPSEYTPACGALLDKMLREIFDPDEVLVVTGGPEVGAAFAGLPFDHLLFTGSTQVGRHVMRAAAENLTPVTLELGGKSPTIISPNYSISDAAASIATGKLFNAGQTCIAPDYVLVPTASKEEFVQAYRSAVEKMYPRLRDNPDYTAIVNQRHFQRLTAAVDEARMRGARVVEINPASERLDPALRKLPPTLMLDVPFDCSLGQDEIFGPVLPVWTYEDLDEAIDFVNERPRPLALYYFDHDQAQVRRVLDETVSGGVTINDTLLHFAQEDLPFGGVGPSGMGSYHGKDGFEVLSKKKPVFYQSRLNGIALMRAPYGTAIEMTLKLLLR